MESFKSIRQKMTSILETLTEIKETQFFEKLEFFKDSILWTSMTAEERDLLALLFTMQGAQQIARGDNKVLGSFEIASQVAPSASLFYEQGMIFVAYAENVRCLTWANEAFAKAAEYNSA